jgi:hypothetical protein
MYINNTDTLFNLYNAELRINVLDARNMFLMIDILTPVGSHNKKRHFICKMLLVGLKPRLPWERRESYEDKTDC